MNQKITNTTNTILDKLKSLSKKPSVNKSLIPASLHMPFIEADSPEIFSDESSPSKFHTILKYIRYFLIFVIIAFLTYKLSTKLYHFLGYSSKSTKEQDIDQTDDDAPPILIPDNKQKKKKKKDTKETNKNETNKNETNKNETNGNNNKKLNKKKLNESSDILHSRNPLEIETVHDLHKQQPEASKNKDSDTTLITALDHAKKNKERHINVLPSGPEHRSDMINTTHGSGYCYIGKDRGFRSCVKVNDYDNCMSGDIFPTSELCINPNLRQ